LTTPSKRGRGQVIEWQVWSAAIGHSARIVHMFLPLDDRGVDGIVRRLDDDAMCAVQVKGRTSLFKGELQVVLRDVAIADENLTIVVVLLDPKTLALAGGTAYGSRWEAHACPIESLADRLLPAPTVPPLAEPLAAIPPGHRDLVGHLAELEVMRLLGEGVELNTFKSFPDIEIAEYLVRHRPSGQIRGLQVKCITLSEPKGHGYVNLHKASFRPSPVVDIVVLTYRSDLGAFDDHAWVIPAADIPTLVSTDVSDIVLMLHPAGGYGSKYDRYRIERPRLAAELTRWFTEHT
jgi:hypothetical protein